MAKKMMKAPVGFSGKMKDKAPRKPDLKALHSAGKTVPLAASEWTDSMSAVKASGGVKK